MAKQNGDGAGHKEEHGAGEEKAVGDPPVVEQAGCLRIERAEETFEATWRSMWVKDARVARLPGYKACKEGKRDRQPGPEDRWDRVGLGCELGGCGGKEGTEEIAEGLADFAEGDQANEKSGGGEDGEEVAQDEGDSGQLCPMHFGG